MGSIQKWPFPDGHYLVQQKRFAPFGIGPELALPCLFQIRHIRAGREHMLKSFTWENTAATLLDLIARLQGAQRAG